MKEDIDPAIDREPIDEVVDEEEVATDELRIEDEM